MEAAVSLPPQSVSKAALPIEAETAWAPEISVRVASTLREFSALAAEWEGLHAQAAVASVFNSWEFQHAWWEVHGRRPLRVLVAARGLRTIGILPLWLDAVPVCGLPVRVLRNLGNGGETNPDDLGPLLAPGEERAAAHALTECLLRMGGYDVACLDDMDGRSPFARLAYEALLSSGRSGFIAPAEKIMYIDLPRDWNAYLASLSGHRRAHLRYMRKKLAEAFGARFFVWDDAQRLDAAAARLAQLHRKRFGEASESFVSAEYNALHLAAMKDALCRDRLRLYCLELAGEIAAILYCFRFRNRIFVMQTGFDPAYAKWSPGSVLLGHAIEHAIGEGNEIFDFLRGMHRYKDELATGSRETVCFTAFRPTVGAAAYRAARHYLPRAKATVREVAQTLKGGR